MLKTCITRTVLQQRLQGAALSLFRLESSTSEGNKAKWASKIKQLDYRNPVRLKRRPQLFANHSSSHREPRQRTQNDSGRYYRTPRDNYREPRPARIFDEESYHPDFDGYVDTPNNRHSNYGQQYQNDRSRVKAPEAGSLAHSILSEMKETGKNSTADQFGDHSDESQKKLRNMVSGYGREEAEVGPDPDVFIRLSHKDRVRSVLTYEKKIERIIRNDRIEDAMDYFERMMAVDRVKPTEFMFGNLVKGYAARNEIRECFKLFNRAKKMGIKPSKHMYTSLFQVCSSYMSEDREYALQQAINLLGILRRTGVVIQPVTYKAAVKTFGILGDVETAFLLADECPTDQGGKYDSYMLSSLLIACNSHKSSGFQLALSAWRMMRRKKMAVLNTDNYNLLLKSLRMGAGDLTEFLKLVQYQEGEDKSKAPSIIETDCSQNEDNLIKLEPLQLESDENKQQLNLHQGLTDFASGTVTIETSAGSEKFSQLKVGEALENVTVSSKTPSSDHLSLPAILTTDSFDLLMYGLSGQADNEKSFVESLDDADVYSRITDMLNPKLKIPSDIKLNNMKRPEDRLMLLGGVRGVLRRMKLHGCQPDVKTFHHLLCALPWELQYETAILKIMQEYGVEPTIHFYTNVMIRMKARKDYGGMFRLYEAVKEKGLTPHLSMYKMLALSHNINNEYSLLLSDMAKYQLTPDKEFVKNLLMGASSWNFEFLTTIMELISDKEITPDDEFYKLLSHKLKVSKQKLVAQEKGESEGKRRIDSNALRAYQFTYQNWLDKVCTS